MRDAGWCVTLLVVLATGTSWETAREKQRKAGHSPTRSRQSRPIFAPQITNFLTSAPIAQSSSLPPIPSVHSAAFPLASLDPTPPIRATLLSIFCTTLHYSTLLDRLLPVYRFWRPVTPLSARVFTPFPSPRLPHNPSRRVSSLTTSPFYSTLVLYSTGKSSISHHHDPISSSRLNTATPRCSLLLSAHCSLPAHSRKLNECCLLTASHIIVASSKNDPFDSLASLSTELIPRDFTRLLSPVLSNSNNTSILSTTRSESASFPLLYYLLFINTTTLPLYPHTTLFKLCFLCNSDTLS